MVNHLKNEKLMILGLIAAIIAYSIEHTLITNGRSVAMITGIVLIIIIIGVAIRVAHHAEIIAEKIGEPYGTMVLTLSAVLVEVIILVIMMNHDNASPTLARDTIYAAIMLDMNGIIGLAALLGGLRHGEQAYNDDSGKTYVVMIMTAVGISMLVPEFLPQDKWTYYSAFTIGIMIILYALFLKMQTGRHSYFFHYNYVEKNKHTHDEHALENNIKTAITLLLIGIVLTGALAEVMSVTLNTGVEGLSVPPILLGLVVATISASPEILTALRAALANRMQPVINIALGATLSTVILTIPVVEAVALFTGQQITMGLTIPQTVMVFLTLIVAAINLNDGETNAIEGMTHFVLFATFIMLSIIGL